MFARIGVFAVRFRWFIIAAWVLLAVVLTLVAPNIDDVAVSDQRAFLPETAASLDANQMLETYFPDRVSPSSAVLVVDAGEGRRVDEQPAAGFIEGLGMWLTGGDAPEVVDQVFSPTIGDDLTRAGLTSEDGRVALLLVRFTKVGTEPATKEAMAAIDLRLDEAPPGVQAFMTGDGPILGAYGTSTKGSVDSTTWITIILVVVILLVIYRSPISPFIPLFTITVAYLISRGVVAFLGAHAITISMYTNVFLIVVLFGAGTDYCLFLISRFREEMAGASTPALAARTTVRAVGATIASSAGTVIVGLAMMTAAELGLYNTSGPSLAVSVAITLLAGLTLAPAVLTVLGHYSFWPRRARPLRETGLWHRWARKVVKRPLVALLVPAVILIPLAVYGGGLDRDFDMLGDLSKENEAHKGFDTLAEHMGAGHMQPLNVIVVDEGGVNTATGLDRTERLAAELGALPHVAVVRSFISSLPDPKTLSVSDQLDVQSRAVRQGLSELESWLSSGRGPSTELNETAAGLLDLYGYLSQLAQQHPHTLQEPGYRQATEALSRLAGLTQTPGVAEDGDSGQTVEAARQAVAHLEDLASGLEALRDAFAARGDAVLLPDLYVKNNEGLAALRDAYLSSDGTAARLQVVLDTGPYTNEAMEATEALRTTVEANGFVGGVEGNSSVMLDLRDAANRDMTRAIVFVLGGIFVVLLLLLRALVAPIYLILTILLSYTATLGVVRLLFVDLLGTSGIVWWVPLFMFVMLVALGMDYNIFLIGRVKEEVALHGTVDGTRLALARTGGIITSAGIIVAGTFASMISASIMGLLQIGFAVAFGVLLDTFVVRTTLVPALVVLLKRWSWWPARTRSASTPPPPAE